MARMFNISGNNTLGGSVENDVIFEADQMVPSSMMMRYALHAMGKDWDLIEVHTQLLIYEMCRITCVLSFLCRNGLVVGEGGG